MGSSRRITSYESFLAQARITHGERYSYRAETYQGASKPLIIMCSIHGAFSQPANVHALKGQGCRKCRQTMNFDEFLHKARLIHGNTYSYERESWTKLTAFVTVICPLHSAFSQYGASHLKGKGCGKCSAARASMNLRLPFKEFVARARLIYGDLYDYEELSYEGTNQKVSYDCIIHGKQIQVGSSHLKGYGCPTCAPKSLGEEAVAKVLDELGLPYQREVSFAELKDIKALRFDFWVPKIFLLIEFDGIGHRSPIRWGSMSFEAAEIEFKKLQARDHLKDKWAKSQGISLLRITDVAKAQEQIVNGEFRERIREAKILI